MLLQSYNEPLLFNCSRADIPCFGDRGCRVVSWAASRSRGSIRITKMRETIENALAALVCHSKQLSTDCLSGTYHHAVIPCKDGQFVQPCYQVPTSCDVAGDKDANGQRGEWVHGSLSRRQLPHLARLVCGRMFNQHDCNPAQSAQRCVSSSTFATVACACNIVKPREARTYWRSSGLSEIDLG